MPRKSHLGPSSDPETLILTSLANGPKHGYAIMQDVEEFSGTRLGPGTLYTAITRLVEKGRITPERAEDRQRPYRLTEEGVNCLSKELDKMQTIAKFGIRRLRFS